MQDNQEDLQFRIKYLKYKRKYLGLQRQRGGMKAVQEIIQHPQADSLIESLQKGDIGVINTPAFKEMIEIFNSNGGSLKAVQKILEMDGGDNNILKSVMESDVIQNFIKNINVDDIINLIKQQSGGATSSSIYINNSDFNNYMTGGASHTSNEQIINNTFDNIHQFQDIDPEKLSFLKAAAVNVIDTPQAQNIISKIISVMEKDRIPINQHGGGIGFDDNAINVGLLLIAGSLVVYLVSQFKN